MNSQFGMVNNWSITIGSTICTVDTANFVILFQYAMALLRQVTNLFSFSNMWIKEASLIWTPESRRPGGCGIAVDDW